MFYRVPQGGCPTDTWYMAERIQSSFSSSCGFNVVADCVRPVSDEGEALVSSSVQTLTEKH